MAPFQEILRGGSLIFLQEAIDVGVILNALRAASDRGDAGGALTAGAPLVAVPNQTAAQALVTGGTSLSGG